MTTDEELTELERSLSRGGVLAPSEKRALIAEARVLRMRLETCWMVLMSERRPSPAFIAAMNDILRPDRKLGEP